jgi:hypothetical protein
MKNFWIDPSSGQLSTSRFGLWLCNVSGVIIAGYLAITGQGLHAAAIITGLGATDAGVYWASTRKDFHHYNEDREDKPE